jgi:hypothetical protein
MPKERRRVHRTTIRWTAEEWTEVQRRAEASCAALASYLRAAALQHKLPANRIPKANLAHVGELNHLGRNLNQALVLVHTGRAAPELESTLERLLALLEEIQELLVGASERSSDD